MVSLAQLWLPIVLSAVFVFIVSSIVHMALKFWHSPDYGGFSNEEEVGTVIRKGNASAGMYILPYCKPDKMKDPVMQERFRQGPVGLVVLRTPGMMNMGGFLGQWFAFCLVISLLAALLGVHTMGIGTPYKHVFGVIGLSTFLAYGLGTVPNAVWWGHPWKSQVKHLVDGALYAAVTAGTFGWLWPH
jgi:hypothetical protein